MRSNSEALTATQAIGRFEIVHDRLKHFAEDHLLNLITKVGAALKDPVHQAEARIERAVAMIENTLRLAIKTTVPEHEHRGGLAPWQIRRLAKFVDENISESVVISDMAALVRLSPHHFCRAFRVSLGESPHRYLIRCRVARAEQLMRTTPIPLGQIASECGFADQAHFTKVFSAACGMSPGAWRRTEAERSIEVEYAVHGPSSSQPFTKVRLAVGGRYGSPRA
jgi:AraC family transcriptional regulator